jgi:hypothetical protein
MQRNAAGSRPTLRQSTAHAIQHETAGQKNCPVSWHRSNQASNCCEEPPWLAAAISAANEQANRAVSGSA